MLAKVLHCQPSCSEIQGTTLIKAAKQFHLLTDIHRHREICLLTRRVKPTHKR